ncbi:MAG: fibronectin type III domain-containing protein [Verrucomicrobiota bacterium]
MLRLLLALLLFGVPVATRAANRLVRGPYLQSAAPDSMVLRWRTQRESKGLVRWGLSPDTATNTTSHPGRLAEHVVRLAGLQPDTRYYYRVGSETNDFHHPVGEDFSFVTPPRPGLARPVRLWVVGDAGTATTNQASVRNAFYHLHRRQPAVLWLMLGDNAYPEGTDAQYQKAVFDMYQWILRRTVLWPTLGNHDGQSADSATLSGPYYDMFTLPTLGQCGGIPSGTEAYYSFDFGRVHFVCLDSHHSNRSATGPMAAWLRADLADTTADWIIAFFQHPPYTKGSHDSDKRSDSGGRMHDMRERFLPILEAGGCDLVLTGHSHSYERSHLLNGHYGASTHLADSMVLDRGGGRVDLAGPYVKPPGHEPHRGTVYLVAGSSGQVSGGPLNHPANWISLNKLGSLVIDIDGLELQGQFLGDQGQLRDYFTLRKR